jgi:dienelactone hydrolase
MPIDGRTLNRPLTGAMAALLLLGAVVAPQAAPPATPPAASPAALPTRAFFELPRYGAAQLSPDGRHLALSATRGEEAMSVFVMDLQAATPTARQIRASVGDALGLQWWGNDLLALVSGQRGTAARQNLVGPRAYTLRLDEQRPRPLDDLAMLPLEVVARAGHAAPQRRVVVADPTLRDGRPPLLRPRWLNLDTRRPEPMALDGAPERVRRWWFDGQGEARLALAEDEQGALRLHVRRGSGAQAVWALHALPGGRASMRPREVWPWQPVAVTEQGRVLASTVLLEPPSATPRAASASASAAGAAAAPALPLGRVAWVHPQTGALELPALVETPGFEPAPQPVFDVDSGALVGLRLNTDQPRSLWFDTPEAAAHAAAQAAADRRLPGRFNRVDCHQCGTPQAVWLVQASSDTQPGELWLYRAALKQWRLVAQRQPQINPAQMAPQAFEWIRARDGRPLPVWLTLPAAVEAGRPAPAVVLVHGGPWVRGGQLAWSPEAQFLASRGYLVIAPDFRGSQGYGWAHVRASWKQWGQAMQDDLADALLWARQQGLATERACIVGGSYGGYAALMGPVRHPGLFRCVAASFPLTDLELLTQGHWLVSDDTSEHTRAVTLPERVGDPKTEAAMLRAHSPVHQAARIDVPVLLASGEADVRVPRAHLERLVDALTAAGRPPRWLRYPHEGHGLRQVEHQVDWADHLAGFLAQHLGPGAVTPTPAPAEAPPGR